MPLFRRILLTGASGSLGTLLRDPISAMTKVLRLSDIKEVRNRATREEVVICDLADADAVSRMTRNVDIVVHMGGAVGAELPFEEILQSNIIGFKNLYEACRKNGVQRVIWGSSNHAFGFYPRTQRIDASATPRPDSFYGVSKVFGEAMAQYYWDKFKLESVSIRIGSCFPKPTDRRMLTTWQSYPDFVHLVECCLRSPGWNTPSSTASRTTIASSGTTAWPPTWAIARRTMRKASGRRSRPNRRPTGATT